MRFRLTLALASLATAAAAAPAQPSMLDLIPADATAAAVVRHNGLSWIRQWLDSDPEMRDELAEHLGRTLGVDLTRVDGAAAFARGPLGEQASFAVWLRIPGPARRLQLPAAGVVEGVDLYKLKKVTVASLDDALVIGDDAEVRAAVALARGKTRPLDASSPLGRELSRDSDAVDLAIAVSAAGVPMVAQYGVSVASLVYHRPRQVQLALVGDPTRLAGTQTMITAGMGVGLNMLEQEKEKAKTTGALEGAGAIVGAHAARRMAREMAPKLTGDRLVSTYTLPAMDGEAAVVPVLGVLAGVAIPSFTKYMKRSKTGEARANVERLFTGAQAFAEEHKADGKRFAFPRSTEWTPAGGCCGQPGDKCGPDPAAFHSPTWQSLGFSIEDPHYFQYRFTSTGKGPGAKFVVEARADLDCDGQFSLYRREGALGKGGAVEGEAMKSEHELE